MSKSVALAFSFASMALAGPASAATIYQSLPDLTVSPVVRGYCSSCNAFLPFRIYDRFTTAADSVINSVTFAVDRQTIAGTSLNLSFFTPNGTRPGASLASYDLSFTDLIPTQQTTALENVFLYTAQIGALSLGAGTYDISFFNPHGLSIPAYQKTGGTLYQSGNSLQGDSFYADRATAFSLDSAAVTAPVPEPATWGMIMLGLGGVGFTMRRRNRQVRITYA